MLSLLCAPLSFAMGVAVIGTCSYFYTKKTDYERIKKVFADVNKTTCYDRERIVTQIKNKLRGNATGITMMIGRVNIGKSTAVLRLLQTEAFVATFDWQAKEDLKTESDLVAALLEAFNVGYIERLRTTMQTTGIFPKIIPWIASIQFSSPTSLYMVLQNLTSKRKFLNWLTKISKDTQLCHVLIASSDSFVYDLIVKQEPSIHPDYIQTRLPSLH